MANKKKDDYSASRREILDRSGSRTSRLRRRDVRDGDEKNMRRRVGFGEWVRLRESASRDASWIASERARLTAWPRDRLISWLMWNDRNGSFSDEDSEREGVDPITLEDAVDLIMGHVEENLQTPEEMVASARGSRAHGQYWNKP